MGGRIELQAPEAAQLRAKAPYCACYSHCELYAETIKSSKTVSRTIVSHMENLVR